MTAKQKNSAVYVRSGHEGCRSNVKALLDTELCPVRPQKVVDVREDATPEQIARQVRELVEEAKRSGGRCFVILDLFLLESERAALHVTDSGRQGREAWSATSEEVEDLFKCYDKYTKSGERTLLFGRRCLRSYEIFKRAFPGERQNTVLTLNAGGIEIARPTESRIAFCLMPEEPFWLYTYRDETQGGRSFRRFLHAEHLLEHAE